MKKLNIFALDFLLKLTRAVFVSLSIWTMVFSPVALGAQAAKQFDQITQNELKQLVINLGLNKRMTYKEFWEKTKHLYPTKVHRDVEATFLSQPSALMPKFEVTFTQDSSGKKVPTLKITDRGNTTNVQIIGELNEWARINGVSLSESDLKQIRPAIEKLNPATVQLETYKKDFNRFTGFPRMTPELWKSLKPEARARYIIEMRLLWFEARRVIEANSPSAKFTPANPKQKKSPINPKQKGKKTSSFEEFIRIFIGQDAQAIGASDEEIAQSNLPPPAGATSGDVDSIKRADAIAKQMASKGYGGKECIPPKGTANALGCVVAGQVARDGAKYYTADNFNGTNRCACNYHATLVQRYNNAPPVEKADAAKYFEEQIAYNKECTRISGSEKDGIFVSCNPLIYGFDPQTGQPHCINTKSREFQNATLYSSGGGASQKTCDQMSPLGPDPEKFVNVKIRDEKDRSKVLELMENDPKAEKNAQDFLQGFLKRKGKLKGDQELATLLADPKSEYDPAIDSFMVDAQEQFEKEIKTAMFLCVQNKTHDASGSQDEACNQLHRRWLFAEKVLTKYRAKACIGGEYVWIKDKTKNRSRINPEEKVCKCPDKSELPLGKACPVAQPPPRGGTAPDCQGSSEPDPENPGACMCTNMENRFDPGADPYTAYMNACHNPANEPGKCEKYGSVANMDPATCLCMSGRLERKEPKRLAPIESRGNLREDRTRTESEGTVTSTGVTIHSSKPVDVKEASYTCEDEGFNWLKWLGIAALTISGIYLLHKLLKKNDDPAYTCNEGPNFRYNQQMGYCYCPLKDTCPGGLYNADCSACVPQPVCTPPKSSGTYPVCSCPNSCLMGTNHPVTCQCEEGGNGNVNPDNNGGGLPPATPTSR